jgi:hypothetical protein
MNVRLNQAIVGQHFNFVPRQVVECTEEQGKRLIRAGIAAPAPVGVQPDGKLIEDAPEEIEQARQEKHARFLLGQTHLPRKDRPTLPERADRHGAETPEARTDGACQGKTGAGFACKRKAIPGKRFCEKHTDEI